MHTIRVLIVDNSIFFRQELVDRLRKHLPHGTLMESASDPVLTREKMLLFRPNVIVANFMMAALRVDGEPFLMYLIRKAGIPIILFGTVPEGEEIARRDGAAAYILKPQDHEIRENFFADFARTLQQTVMNYKPRPAQPEKPLHQQAQQLDPGKVLTRTDWEPAHKEETASSSEAHQIFYPGRLNSSPNKKSSSDLPQPKEGGRIELIAIGSSTGGTEAISAVLKGLRAPLPGIVIVQHIPPTFSRLLADRLDLECQIHVKEGATGDRVMPNTVYIAPGGKHMTVSRVGKELLITCAPGPKVHSCCPSVDVLFDSVAKEVGGKAMGVILTGMGRDGASGLLAMKKKGSPTIGQDEESCVVYGMPRAAWEIGAVDQQYPLDQIAYAITKIARG